MPSIIVVSTLRGDYMKMKAIELKIKMAERSTPKLGRTSERWELSSFTSEPEVSVIIYIPDSAIEALYGNYGNLRSVKNI